MSFYPDNKYTDEDLLKLVQLVKDRPSLYNKKNRFYANKIKREEEWKEIGTAMGWKEMGRSCCVPGCTSNYTSGNSYVTSFKFPKDEERKKLWIKKINRKNFYPSSTAVVCINHFSERFIVREDRAIRDDGSEIVVPRVRVKLTADAYPSIHTNQPKYISSEPPPELKAPSQRLKEILDRDEAKFQGGHKNDDKASNVTINGPIMTEKANEIAKSLNVTDFSGSTGWLDRFRKRFGINYRKISGEAEAVNDDTIDPWIENLLPNLLKDYSPDDVHKRCKAMRCKERWRGIRDTYKRGLNKKRINEHKSNKYTDFPLEFLVEHVTDQRARGPSKQAGPPENEVALVKVEPPSPGDNSTVSEDFILPDHLNEEIASESDPNSSSTKSGPDQPLVVLPQSNDRPQLSRMLVVRRTPTPSGTPTTGGVQQPFVVVGNDGLAKTTTAVVMNANASSQPQFVMMPTTAQQQQFVVVGQQQQTNTGNNNNNNDVTSPQQFVVVGQQQQANTSNSNINDVTSPQQFVVVGQQQQANTSNSNNKKDATSPQQFVVVGQQQQGKTNNKNVKAAASSVPPKVSSGRKKKKKRVMEESDDSDGENPVDSFFRSMAQTVKKFPPLLVAEAKMEVCRVVTRLECEMLKGRFDQPSNSNSFVCDSASEPKKEESILGYSLFS